jgi:uncharacterized cupin superfamily protein
VTLQPLTRIVPAPGRALACHRDPQPVVLTHAWDGAIVERHLPGGYNVITEPIAAQDVPAHLRKSVYPAPFASQVEGRVKRRLGDHFALSNFGINLTELAPGSVSALLHHHTQQDEFIYIISGTPTLVLDDREYLLRPGDCCGFKAGTGVGHQLINRSSHGVLYLEIGDRTAGDYATYPRDDLKFTRIEGGAWILTHKDGTPYD